ncbi:23S rRNA (adenine2503-C2)-methyltransferase [Dendrobium catenatum]|uniref:23S rRNA (Adenine2503-C2)-methyltransferase n=1 Tax=Dendrobium catenatum TaxID=906689 RepID=A0A2I0VKF7_9ASPA|nr:23S rRNA (adenine2503-C2)-methyltransferase [Dendrobium catenatum]
MAIEEIFKHRVTNVVFMGMGEPMLNLKSVLEAHRCLNKLYELELFSEILTKSCKENCLLNWIADFFELFQWALYTFL